MIKGQGLKRARANVLQQIGGGGLFVKPGWNCQGAGRRKEKKKTGLVQKHQRNEVLRKGKKR